MRSWRRVPTTSADAQCLTRGVSSRQPLLPTREVVNPTATRVVLTLICSIAALAVAETESAAASPTCLGHKATIVGTNAADHLVGTAARDVIAAGRGLWLAAERLRRAPSLFGEIAGNICAAPALTRRNRRCSSGGLTELRPNGKTGPGVSLLRGL